MTLTPTARLAGVADHERRPGHLDLPAVVDVVHRVVDAEEHLLALRVDVLADPGARRHHAGVHEPGAITQ